MSEFSKELSVLIRKRAGYKSYINVCVDKLIALDDAELNIHFKARKVTILTYMDKVLTVDESIIDLYDQLVGGR